MTATVTVLRDAVLAALRHQDVAAAAVVDRDEWAADAFAGGHVFEGLSAFIGARNRGRMPFVEFVVSEQRGDQLAYAGGSLTSTVEIAIHVGGRPIDAAADLAQEIAAAAIAAVRTVPANGYTILGDDQVGALQSTPLGHVLPVKLTVVQTQARY